MQILSEEQTKIFERDGFLMVRDFYNRNEMKQITGWVDEVQAYPDAPGKYQRYYETRCWSRASAC